MKIINKSLLSLTLACMYILPAGAQQLNLLDKTNSATFRGSCYRVTQMAPMYGVGLNGEAKNAGSIFNTKDSATINDWTKGYNFASNVNPTSPSLGQAVANAYQTCMSTSGR